MDVKISQMANAQVLEDSDFFPAVQGSINVKVTMAQVKSYIGSVTPSVSWSTVSDKPFASISSTDFTVSNDELAINPAIKSKFHEHSNKVVLDKFAESSDGSVTYNGQSIAGVSTWTDISGKPFNTVSAADFKIVGNELQLSGSASGLDFTALSNSLTTGTLSGLTITPDTANSNFDITVTGIPEIAIDAEGYWTINGERGENPTKAQGEKGSDGFSPTVTATVVSNGVDITIIDKNGNQQVGIRNGTDGANGTDGKSAYQSAVDAGFEGSEEDWLASLKGQDGVTTIQTSKVDKTCTFTAEGWSSAVPYTQTVTVEGITESLNPRIDLKVSENIVTGKKEEVAFSYFTRVTTGDGTLTAYCYETKPDIDITIMIEVI